MSEKMREHQKVYFASKDTIALGNAKQFEKIVGDCIVERRARTEAQTEKTANSQTFANLKNKAIQEDFHGKNQTEREKN
jgi:hypothetical protein